jgi:hypothetical protein
MMTNTFTLLPVLACSAMLLMMFAAAAARLARRTPLARLSWFERRARRARDAAKTPGG